MSFSVEQDPGSLSIPVPVHEIGGGGRTVSFSADETGRAGLADRFALRAVLELTLEGKLGTGRDGDYRFRGRLKARVVQACVVTLEPVENTIDESMALRFVRSDEVDESGHEVMVEAEEEEEVEPMSGDIVDLGPATAEQFGVALDPYPRKPGAEAPQTPAARVLREGDEGATRENPFKVLKNLGTGG